MKKLLLGLGSFVTAVAPVAGVVACGKGKAVDKAPATTPTQVVDGTATTVTDAANAFLATNEFVKAYRFRQANPVVIPEALKNVLTIDEFEKAVIKTDVTYDLTVDWLMELTTTQQFTEYVKLINEYAATRTLADAQLAFSKVKAASVLIQSRVGGWVANAEQDSALQRFFRTHKIELPGSITPFFDMQAYNDRGSLVLAPATDEYEFSGLYTIFEDLIYSYGKYIGTRSLADVEKNFEEAKIAIAKEVKELEATLMNRLAALEGQKPELA